MQGFYCDGLTDRGLSHVARLPELQEFDISIGNFNCLSQNLEAIGIGCPKLKCIKFKKVCKFSQWESIELNSELSRDGSYGCDDDKEALAIAKTMPGIQYIQLVGSRLTNKGLIAILDGCTHLECLKLQRCFNIDLGESLKERCGEKVKFLDDDNDYHRGP